MRRLRGLPWLVCLLLCAHLRAGAEESRTWRVCLPDLAAPPYLYNDPTHLGIVERLIVDGGRKAGLKVVFLRLPPKRCRVTVESHEADAVVVSPSQEMQGRYAFPLRSGSVDVSRRIANFSFVWIKRRDSPYAWNEGQLSGADPATLTVGTRVSVRLAIESLRNLGFNIDDSAMSTRQLLLKLTAKRIDLAMGIQEEVEYAMKDPALSSLVVLPQPFIKTELYLALRKDLTPEEQQQAQAWWSAIGKLRDTRAYRVR